MEIKSTEKTLVNYIKMLIYGNSGVGKTTLAATLPGKPLIISAESGLLSLRGAKIDFVEVGTLQEVFEVYDFLKKSADAKKYDSVVLDSISEIGEVVLSYEKSKHADMRQAYGSLLEQMTALVRGFRDLSNRHVYFSAKQEQIKDDSGKIVGYGPAMPGSKLGPNLPYFFDEVFALRLEKDDQDNDVRVLQTASDNRFTAKDRSGVLDKFEQPDLGAIIKKILGEK